MAIIHHAVLVALLASLPPSSQQAAQAPAVTIRNGSVFGTYNPVLDIDSFLGVPYAQPPLGALRFELPRPLNETWPEPLNASTYGPWCLAHSIGLAFFTQEGIDYPQSEDCLTLNIIRPANVSVNARLPALVWIYGGGFADGGSSDLRYNMSQLAATSAAMGMPTIMVSFNYRLSGWGFLTNRARTEAGLGNVGLHDQRMALAWLQDNLEAFGGDPARVTIFGESAGAFSVGFHLLAYAESESRPFHAAIAQSGSPLAAVPTTSIARIDEAFNALLASSGCANTTAHVDHLTCLRGLPAETLHHLFTSFPWYAAKDGVLIPKDPAAALLAGNFSQVPLIIGTTTNEATAMVSSYSPPINTTAEIPLALAAVDPTLPPSNDTVRRLLDAYAALDLTAELGPSVLPNPGPGHGAEYGRATLYVGDVMFTGGRRLSNRAWAARGVPSYSYRFDTIPAGVDDDDPPVLGATHFAEVPFVFGDTSGQGWATNPFAVEPAERRAGYEELARLVSRMWISFANTLSPNNHGLSGFDVEWPVYSSANPVNMVFDGNAVSYVEKDDWRTAISDILIERASEFATKS